MGVSPSVLRCQRIFPPYIARLEGRPRQWPSQLGRIESCSNLLDRLCHKVRGSDSVLSIASEIVGRLIKDSTFIESCNKLLPLRIPIHIDHSMLKANTMNSFSCHGLIPFQGFAVRSIQERHRGRMHRISRREKRLGISQSRHSRVCPAMLGYAGQ